MKTILFALTTLFLFSCNCRKAIEAAAEFPALTGKYLDQKEPGLNPELFAPTIVSTGMRELNSLFSPDFREFYYTIVIKRQYVIMKMQHDGNKWSSPEVAEFSGKYSDADPYFTADGKWIYFISQRPVDSTGVAKSDWDIWRVEKINGKWCEAERLDSTINSESSDTYPCLTSQGTLYFCSGRKGASRGRDIFYAKKKGDSFEVAVKIEGEVNDFANGDVYVSPDEDYLIYVSRGRPEGNGLYISFMENGAWSTPQNMGEEINMTGNEYCPIVSPDGKYFFFTSSNIPDSQNEAEKLTYKKIIEEHEKAHLNPQMGSGDIYWVDVNIVEQYRGN